MAPRRTIDDPRQASLFETADSSGVSYAELDLVWRRSMARAIADSRKSREQIAAEMERWGGGDPEYPISKATLDAFTASSKAAWRFPVIYLRAFIAATGATWLLDQLVDGTGRIMVSEEEALPAVIGVLEADRKRLDTMIREKKGELDRRWRSQRRGIRR